MAESATLKMAKLPTEMKSTTWPIKNPGARHNRSTRFPKAPPAMSAKAKTIQGSLVRGTMTAASTKYPNWMHVKTHVAPVPKENAAPGLKTRRKRNQSPSSMSGTPGSKKWRMSAFVSWSIRAIPTTTPRAAAWRRRREAGRRDAGVGGEEAVESAITASIFPYAPSKSPVDLYLRRGTSGGNIKSCAFSRKVSSCPRRPPARHGELGGAERL